MKFANPQKFQLSNIPALRYTFVDMNRSDLHKYVSLKSTYVLTWGAKDL